MHSRRITTENGHTINPAGLVDENVKFTPSNKTVLPGNANLVGGLQQLITVVDVVVVVGTNVVVVVVDGVQSPSLRQIDVPPVIVTAGHIGGQEGAVATASARAP